MYGATCKSNWIYMAKKKKRFFFVQFSTLIHASTHTHIHCFGYGNDLLARSRKNLSRVSMYCASNIFLSLLLHLLHVHVSYSFFEIIHLLCGVFLWLCSRKRERMRLFHLSIVGVCIQIDDEQMLFFFCSAFCTKFISNEFWNCFIFRKLFLHIIISIKFDCDALTVSTRFNSHTELTCRLECSRFRFFGTSR